MVLAVAWGVTLWPWGCSRSHLAAAPSVQRRPGYHIGAPTVSIAEARRALIFTTHVFIGLILFNLLHNRHIRRRTSAATAAAATTAATSMLPVRHSSWVARIPPQAAAIVRQGT